MAVNWRQLLKKYMAHVRDEEGTSFVDYHGAFRACGSYSICEDQYDVSDEESKALAAIDKEIDSDVRSVIEKSPKCPTCGHAESQHFRKNEGCIGGPSACCGCGKR